MLYRFLKLDSNNVVIQSICVDSADCEDEGGSFSESEGVELCRSVDNDSSGTWKVDLNDQASIGWVYVSAANAFATPKPDNAASWTLNTTSGEWESPIGAAPTLTSEQIADNYYYTWIESDYQADNTTGWSLQQSSGSPPLI